MSAVSDPELLSFAAELLEKHGGLVETRPEALSVLLPPTLAEVLRLPEESLLGEGGVPLLYGSPVLEQLIGLATADVPVAYGHIEAPYLKKGGFEQLIGRDIVFADGQARIGARAEARTTYMVAMFHYVALSDERKEGLVRVGVHEGSGAVITDLDERLQEFKPEFFLPGKVPPHFPVHLEQAVSSAVQTAKDGTESELSEFLSSMQRRLQRDVKNTREYYDALKEEMEASLSHHSLTDAQRQERMEKIQELPLEMERKIEDLKQKYQVQVTVTARAALRLLVDVAQIMLELRYRKAHRTVRVIWNPITRRLDPLVCERCRETTHKVHPAVKDAGIELLCFACSRKKR